MGEPQEWVIIVDARTGKQACSGIWYRKSAEAQIRHFRDRQAAGGRPDITAEDVAALTIQSWRCNEHQEQ